MDVSLVFPFLISLTSPHAETFSLQDYPSTPFYSLSCSTFSSRHYVIAISKSNRPFRCAWRKTMFPSTPTTFCLFEIRIITWKQCKHRICFWTWVTSLNIWISYIWLKLPSCTQKINVNVKLFTGSFGYVQCGIVISISMEASQTKTRNTIRYETIFIKRKFECYGVR